MATLENGSAHYAARELGQGWKVNPFVTIKPKETYTMAEIKARGYTTYLDDTYRQLAIFNSSILLG